ncbi:mlr6215 [Mesorhizobium japonicum MAFF 303099]|uniref:Mlr6215 protein n=1 Tax=Mesorhizobium japonicum (strain LMG 29417 / CECT 9101 / MAFF 303099) TaxID=266835 RepID=Q98A02_RHILO|nr:mlr6215 [Mesorhizobium japonicum MAFF 303099]
MLSHHPERSQWTAPVADDEGLTSACCHPFDPCWSLSAARSIHFATSRAFSLTALPCDAQRCYGDSSILYLNTQAAVLDTASIRPGFLLFSLQSIEAQAEGLFGAVFLSIGMIFARPSGERSELPTWMWVTSNEDKEAECHVWVKSQFDFVGTERLGASQGPNYGCTKGCRVRLYLGSVASR